MNKKGENHVNSLKKQVFTVKNMVAAAVLLSMSLVINYFTKVDIPIGGAPVLRLSFGGPFLKMIALLFGPLYGGVCGALSDYIGHIIRPMGAYLWPLTVMAFLHNFAIGLLWVYIKKINFKIYNAIYLAFFGAAALLGSVNWAVLKFGSGSYKEFLLNMGNKANEADSLAVGLMIVGVAGLAAHFIAWFISKRQKDGDSKLFEQYLKLIVCIMIPGLINTTINTVILRYFGLSADNAFIFIWIPRIIKETLNSMYNIYFVTILLKALESTRFRLSGQSR